MKNKRSFFFQLLIVFLSSGCVSSTLEEIKQSEMVLGSEDSIVLLGRRESYGHRTESGFVSCVAGKLKGVSVLEEDSFVDALFPWMEPRRSPQAVGDLSSLMARSEVRSRIKELGVRYMVWLDGATKTDESGSMTCSIGPGGGGCFGFLTFEQDSEYEVSVWDLEKIEAVGRISTQANGTSYVPGFVVPIPIIARVQNTACVGVAERLQSFIGKSTREEA